MEKEKVSRSGEDAKEQDEDMKMEKFFALMRRFGEARKRLRKEFMEDDIDCQGLNKKMMIWKRSTADDQRRSSTWVPSFQRDDFTTEIDFIAPPLILPNPCNHSKEPNKQVLEEDTDLDLKLKL